MQGSGFENECTQLKFAMCTAQYQSSGLQIQLNSGQHLVVYVYNTSARCIGGRYLNDIWALNLDKLTWQQITTTSKPLPPVGGGQFAEEDPDSKTPLLNKGTSSQAGNTAALPPSAGHVLVAWGSSLLCIGGHTKAGIYSQLRKVLPAC